jgi:hypothetical protein
MGVYLKMPKEKGFILQGEYQAEHQKPILHIKLKIRTKIKIC